MEFGKYGITAVAYVLVFAACAIADDFTPAFLIAAAISLALLALGIAFFPRFRAPFRIAIPNATSEDSPNLSVNVRGVEIPVRPYPQVASCVLVPRHIPELLACGVIAAATLIIVTSGGASYGKLLVGWGLFALEGACIAGAGVMLLCLAWADECIHLRRASPTLAPISGIRSGLGHQQLIYEFVDQHGNRYGGYTRIFGGEPENVVVVFYVAKNPDVNRAHCSLHFHDVRIHSVAAMRLPTESPQQQVPS